jgi:hypothetical protein
MHVIIFTALKYVMVLTLKTVWLIAVFVLLNVKISVQNMFRCSLLETIYFCSCCNCTRLLSGDVKFQVTKNKTDSLIVIMWMTILMITLWSLTKGYWTAYALYTNNNYIFSFKHHNLHISVSISSCSWYEFQTEILKHIVVEKYTAAQF